MSTTNSARMETFLRHYELAINSTNPADAAGQFSDIFLAATSAGTTPVPLLTPNRVPANTQISRDLPNRNPLSPMQPTNICPHIH